MSERQQAVGLWAECGEYLLTGSAERDSEIYTISEHWACEIAHEEVNGSSTQTHCALQGSGKAKQLLSIIFLVTFHSIE